MKKYIFQLYPVSLSITKKARWCSEHPGGHTAGYKLFILSYLDARFSGAWVKLFPALAIVSPPWSFQRTCSYASTTSIPNSRKMESKLYVFPNTHTLPELLSSHATSTLPRKALKVVDLKEILSKAQVAVTGKTNKPDLIAKILASPEALKVYEEQYGSPAAKDASEAAAPASTKPASSAAVSDPGTPVTSCIYAATEE